MREGLIFDSLAPREFQNMGAASSSNAEVAGFYVTENAVEALRVNTADITTTYEAENVICSLPQSRLMRLLQRPADVGQRSRTASHRVVVLVYLFFNWPRFPHTWLDVTSCESLIGPYHHTVGPLDGAWGCLGIKR